MKKDKAIWCPLRDYVCSRDKDEILYGRRGLCTIDTSTSGCPAEEQGFDLTEIDVYVVDGTVVTTEKDAIKMLIRRIKIALDRIEDLLKHWKDERVIGEEEG